jgi:hypothetical protein
MTHPYGTKTRVYTSKLERLVFFLQNKLAFNKTLPAQRDFQYDNIIGPASTFSVGQ